MRVEGLGSVPPDSDWTKYVSRWKHRKNGLTSSASTEDTCSTGWYGVFGNELQYD